MKNKRKEQPEKAPGNPRGHGMEPDIEIRLPFRRQEIRHHPDLAPPDPDLAFHQRLGRENQRADAAIVLRGLGRVPDATTRRISRWSTVMARRSRLASVDSSRAREV